MFRTVMCKGLFVRIIPLFIVLSEKYKKSIYYGSSLVKIMR
ncbi:hypothetical protein Hamer_G010545 [Homarus americanus]|uniref:Uncharacterized protein n=1 Tax=Homarus americanus TaxID=6706 RepID=A0A8J5K8X3_HOMAM|nr:hypothetical protein Hamer_G010545 [Homarus americanus]